jgi:hypothetical protein
MSENNKIAIVACTRSEPEYLTEWLVYHQNIGFDHVYLYCNDDDPLPCFETIMPFNARRVPFVTMVHFPFVGVKLQMYRHFLKHKVHDVEWFIFLDVDEFLVFRDDGNVRNFLANRQKEADMVFINSLVFGPPDFREKSVGSVLLNCTRRSRNLSPVTKVLTRASTVNAARYLSDGKAGFWQNWDFRGEQLSRAVNVLGEDMSAYFGEDKAGRCAFLQEGDRTQRIIATALIHRYVSRSPDDILKHLKPGTSEDVEGQFFSSPDVLESGTGAFLRQFSEVEDMSLHDHWRALLTVKSSVFSPDC